MTIDGCLEFSTGAQELGGGVVGAIATLKPLPSLSAIIMIPPTETSPSATYHQMAQAIAFMRAHHREQPDLAAIAAQVHLSPCHFQRTFTQWAGISPKRFSQYLSVEYAKSRLAATQNVLELSLATGLSSPGRLHDLFVKLEAMSPGEYKQGGAGLQIRYGIEETRFGPCAIALTARGICNVQFLEAEMGEEAVREHLIQAWPNAEIQSDPAATRAVGDRLFAPLETQTKPLTLHVKGTNFQIQVWRALLQIPFGGITTYQTLAGQIGRPTAARAVGNAVGKNPIGYLIPCHRVLRESGEVGGYRWGVERKAALLGWEASQVQS